MTDRSNLDLEISDFDEADYLRNDDEALLYLQACIEEAGQDSAVIASALGVVIRARAAMTKVATHAGLSRESLYKTISGDRDPAFSTILKILDALGLKIGIERVKQAAAPALLETSALTTNFVVAQVSGVASRKFESGRALPATTVNLTRSERVVRPEHHLRPPSLWLSSGNDIDISRSPAGDDSGNSIEFSFSAPKSASKHTHH